MKSCEKCFYAFNSTVPIVLQHPTDFHMKPFIGLKVMSNYYICIYGSEYYI